MLPGRRREIASPQKEREEAREPLFELQGMLIPRPNRLWRKREGPSTLFAGRELPGMQQINVPGEDCGLRKVSKFLDNRFLPLAARVQLCRPV